MLAMEPTSKLVLGSIAFGIFWVLAVFPAVPFLPIGRTAGSLLGAMLMVLLQVVSADEAYDAINLQILGLLFGTMVVSVYLERADMFKYLGKLLSWKSQGGKDLLCRICVVSAVASALFTNDTCCVVLTEFILKIARQNNLPPKPFLLALASSANIGSATTPIGNPQNLVIAVQSKIPFGDFLFGILPAMMIGIVLNAGILLCYFWGDLSGEKYHYKEVDVSPQPEVVEEEDVTCHRFSPATMSHNPSSSSGSLMDCLHSPLIVANGQEDIDGHVYNSHSESKEGTGVVRRNVKSNGKVTNCTKEASFHQLPDEEATIERWQRLLWNGCVYAVTLGMLIALWSGLNMSWSAITAALALIVLDFKDAGPCLEKVILLFLLF
jgi:Citrate transporter